MVEAVRKMSKEFLHFFKSSEFGPAAVVGGILVVFGFGGVLVSLFQ